jgi:hypothetical protein
MNPDEIKIDHCYLMRPIHRRRIVVRVTKLLNVTMGMAASEDVQQGGTESLKCVVLGLIFLSLGPLFHREWGVTTASGAAG